MSEPEVEDLIDAAELGEQAKRFIDSDVGQTLLARAEQDKRAAEEALGECDPDDKKRITELIIQVRVAKKIPEYLNEILTIGEEAIAVWRQQNGET